MYQVPLVMGHEIAGEVAELGENVSEVKIGDKVVCFTVALDVSSGELKGLGTFQDGGFAEYLKVPKDWVFKIPANIPTKEAVMIETFALANRAFNLSKIENGEKILIFGGGSVGLTVLKALLIEKSPEYVIVAEPNEFLRNKALELGATEAVPSRRSKIKKVIRSLGEPKFIFDTVGIKETLSDAMFLIKRGGTILLEGISRESIDFPFFNIISKEVALIGCFGHDSENILAAIDMFAKNNQRIRKLSVTCSLSDPDDYEGGDLEFSLYNPERSKRNNLIKCTQIRPKGSIVVFPSYIWHRVNPVIKGTRYSLVIWNQGDPFR